MCGNDCDDCQNGCQGCGDEEELNILLLKGLDKVVTLVQNLDSRVTKLEKQNKKLKKLVSRMDIGEYIPSDCDRPSELIEGLLTELAQAVTQDFLTDRKGNRVPIEKRPNSGETAPHKAKAEVAGNTTETKGSTVGKESVGNPNSVTITLTKSKGKKPVTVTAVKPPNSCAQARLCALAVGI